MSVEDGNVGVSLDLLQNPIALDMTTDGGFAAALNEVRRLKRGGVCIVGLLQELFWNATSLACNSGSDVWMLLPHDA